MSTNHNAPGTIPPVITRLAAGALDRLVEGLAVFDGDLELVYCNEPFKTLRDYPDRICALGTHISELYRFNAERGDYGPCDVDREVEIRVDRAKHGGDRAFDQNLADGSILHTRYAPVPGAGLLFTYEDVTEKRATEQALRESQEALRISEERHAIAIASVNEGIYDWDIVRGEVYYSSQVAGVLGFEPEALRTNEDWLARIHPDDAGRYREEMVAHLKGETERFDCEYRYQRPDGTWRWARQHGMAMRGEGGRAERLIGSTGDITEQRALSFALDQARERLNDALESISEGFVLWDADSRLVLCNRTYRERLFPGMQDMVVEGVHFADLARAGVERGVIQDVGEDVEGWIESRLADHRDPRGPVERHRGGDLWVQINERKTRDGGVVGVYTDISQRKRSEEELTRSRQRIVDAIEALAEGFVLYDADDRIVMYNGVFNRYFSDVGDLVKPGTSFDHLIKSAAQRGLFPLAEGRVDEWFEEVKAKRSQASGSREQHLRGDLWLRVSDHRTSDGGLVAVFTDISDIKRREAELREAKESAERSLESLRLAQRGLIQAEKMASLGQLTAGIAHEIKNPLNFINNFAETSSELLDELAELIEPVTGALETDDRKEVADLLTTLKSDLGTIAEHGRRADGIVKGMLSHSRGESGARSSTDLNALIDESLNLAYHGQRAATPGFNVTLERRFDAGLGEFELVPQAIRRVLVNLLGNSFYAVHKRQEATPGAGYEPTVSVTTALLDDDRARILVRDNGSGIPRSVIDDLFTPFFTTKPPGEGTGLGLSISRDIIVEQHGGRIEVESEEGAYTQFSIELPRVAG